MTVHAFSSTPAADTQRESLASLIPGATGRELVLASTSASLLRLLESAGLAIRSAPTAHNEMQTLQMVLGTMSEPDPSDVAELHMRIKIDDACMRFPGALVIAAHQVVSIEGTLRETPSSLDAARDLLFELRGRTHQLHLAIALAEEGVVTWSTVNTAQLTMRPLSATFIGRYLAAAELQAVGSPGAYQLDGLGLQLFENVQGTYPEVLGAPLFPLFARLREIGFMVT